MPRPRGAVCLSMCTRRTERTQQVLHPTHVRADAHVNNVFSVARIFLFPNITHIFSERMAPNEIAHWPGHTIKFLPYIGSHICKFLITLYSRKALLYRTRHSTRGALGVAHSTRMTAYIHRVVRDKYCPLRLCHVPCCTRSPCSLYAPRRYAESSSSSYQSQTRRSPVCCVTICHRSGQ